VTSDTLQRVAERLREEGGLLAEAVVDPGRAAPNSGWEPVEAIREGYLLHYAEARLVATEDTDLALLAGDRLYALGLAELAELGDLEAVRTMAEVIASAAAAHAADDRKMAAEAWRQAPEGASSASGDR
jgi:hypothetical protein